MKTFQSMVEERAIEISKGDWRFEDGRDDWRKLARHDLFCEYAAQNAVAVERLIEGTARIIDPKQFNYPENVIYLDGAKQ